MFNNICKKLSKRIYNISFRLFIIYNCPGLKTNGTVHTPSTTPPHPTDFVGIHGVASVMFHKEVACYTIQSASGVMGLKKIIC